MIRCFYHKAETVSFFFYAYVFQAVSFLSSTSTENLHEYLLFPIRATCPAHHIIIDMSTLKYLVISTYHKIGRMAQLVKLLTTSWTVRGSNPGGGEIFRPPPDRPWDPHSLLYNGYRVFPGDKVRPGRDADHSPPSSAEVLEEYSYTSTPLWATTGPVTELLYLYIL
jgi:hypothetical protein